MTAGVREQQDLAHWVVLAGESLAQATMHTKLRQCRGNGLPSKLGSADSAEKGSGCSRGAQRRLPQMVDPQNVNESTYCDQWPMESKLQR